MLKPEQAQKELEKLRKEDWVEVNLRDLGRLPPTARTLGRSLLGKEEDGKQIRDWDKRLRDRQQAMAELDKDAAQRRKLFAVLFPKLEKEVEAAWQLCTRLPYQYGYARKAFRAPRHRRYAYSRIGQWLEALTLTDGVSGYEQDVVWWAAWATYRLPTDTLGILFAAAIDAGGKTGDEVFDILCASAKNEHEIGGMGRHVSRGLLASSRADGWELMEKMLLAGQRQEGLRQTILESIDEAHPDAFRRMLRLILEHDLARFSSVVRAVDVWFGFQWDSASTRVVNEAIEYALKYLEDDDARQKAIKKGDGDDLYLALWATAFDDAVAAVDVAAPLLADKNQRRKFIAAHLLAQLSLPPAKEKLVPVLADDDLRIAWHAFRGFYGGYYDEGDEEQTSPKDLFERLEKLLERIPGKGVALKALVWPWMAEKAQPREVLSSLTTSLGERPPTRLLPYLSRMDGWTKQGVVDQLAKQKKWDAVTRETLFAFVGDSNAGVRERAVQALENCKVNDDEAEQLEGLLTRKANDLRRGVLSLLIKQKDEAALASAERLLASNDTLHRLAGLEILREMAVAKRQVEKCRARVEKFRSDRPRLTKEEDRFLETLADAGQDKPTLDNALGLLDPAERTKTIPPKKRLDSVFSPAAVALIQSLDELVHQHREEQVVIRYRPVVRDEDEEDYDYGYDEPVLDYPIEVELHDPAETESKPGPLGEFHGFPNPEPKLPVEEDLAYLPLADVWQRWYTERPQATRDKDGLEILRAHGLLKKIDDEEWWDELTAAEKKAVKALYGDTKLKKLNYQELVGNILQWLLRLHPPHGAADFLLDALETSYAAVPQESLRATREPRKVSRWVETYVTDWRDSYRAAFTLWHAIARDHFQMCPQDWTGKHHIRLYQLQNWKDHSVPGVGRSRPSFEEVLDAYKAGGATRADLVDLILGPPNGEGSSYQGSFPLLADLTARRPLGWSKELRELADASRKRILEIELQRGDTPTAASSPALSLQSVWGIDTLIRILQALGKEKFHRGYSYRENLGKACVFTHLAAVCYPNEGETYDEFAKKMRAAEVSEDRLVELAFKAPQWVKFVEHTLGWEGFSEGVWWFLAHTRDSGQPFDKAWRALLDERTALTTRELQEGAVDVAWFHRAHNAVGPKRWPTLDEAAKFASMAGGYRRAQFLASVLLGKAKRNTLIADIKKKHLKETVRALGLLPLASGAARDQDVAERYKVLQDYHRYARGLSAMSREGAVRAAEVGLANLARTAGYADPVRFQWSMEAAACADLVKGVSARAGAVEVNLAVDGEGQVQWSVLNKGKSMKAIPPAQRKDKKIAELAERKKELTRSRSRIRRTLEDMMCRGDAVTGAELGQLMHHPLLAPMLGRLVIAGEGILGYPEKKGQALRDHAGKLEPVKKNESLRLAHPHDLLDSGKWDKWQHDCFRREVVQPFKQVFRELYVVTAAEKKEGNLSRRYAGQQVQPRQATALWAGRGWGVSEYEGIRKTFHDVGINAWVGFQYTAATAAEVEGWTLEAVGFARVKDHKPLKLTDVPPRLFSEVMRDMDLVVSVAHRGGVDPEASASTVEMRGNLLRELCELLKLKNVRQKQQHVLIDGKLSQYSVHLGSGGVHRLPGGALFIIPVHAQHRGRLFLPFADDDPKTAEILSKILLLARDEEIQDPSILEQLR